MGHYWGKRCWKINPVENLTGAVAACWKDSLGSPDEDFLF